MEKLFENPILLFALIAIVSSMFSKIKGKPEAKNKRPGRLPELARELQDMAGEVARQNERGSGRRPVRREEPQVQARTDKAEAVREAVNSVPALAAAMEKREETKRPVLQDAGKGRDGQDIAIEPVTEKNLADAVVWAEILGPPRSKKPYYKR
ncbi:hypothetical protein [Bacillus sp. FJAT-27245]|uniref:hypothetical protein n=1 Tax=Bacillus sp. FJAT-27245 TaxID=1684144 RepID=UPI0006A7E18F|nr:hypothetical protein [Bacillus sp. FJAT-27245]